MILRLSLISARWLFSPDPVVILSSRPISSRLLSPAVRLSLPSRTGLTRWYQPPLPPPRPGKFWTESPLSLVDKREHEPQRCNLRAGAAQ